MNDNFLIGFLFGLISAAFVQANVFRSLLKSSKPSDESKKDSKPDDDILPMFNCPQCALPAEAALVFVLNEDNQREIVSSYVMIYCLGLHDPISVSTEWFEQYVDGQ